MIFSYHSECIPGKDKLVFMRYPRSLPKNHPNCTILDNWVLKSLLADETFVKALQIFETCVLVNNNVKH